MEALSFGWYAKPSVSEAFPSGSHKRAPFGFCTYDAHMPAPSTETEDLVGQTLFGTYTVTEKLGEGAMGNVYLAKQAQTGQRIAIKVLNAEAAQHQETVARFLREARVISMMTHPYVVRVFIFGETKSGISYMAMEQVDG